MSYKQSHLAWLSGTHPANMRLPIRRAWGAAPTGTAPTNVLDTKFLRSWLVYDSSLDADKTDGSANWNIILGLGLAVGVSAGFWVALGLIASYFLK
jgi:hypothetical protein